VSQTTTPVLEPTETADEFLRAAHGGTDHPGEQELVRYRGALGRPLSAPLYLRPPIPSSIREA